MKKKLTTPQKKLLQDLKQSKDRGAGSMSANLRSDTAKELLDLGLVRVKSKIGNTQFYALTDEGMKFV